MELWEKTLSSETVFAGRIVEVLVDQIELPNGKKARREVVRHPGGVAVVPYHDDGTVTVVRQFRYPFGQVVTEVPAGKLEWENGAPEDHRAAGIRELSEETGLTADEFVYLGCLMPSPGFSREVLHMYLAKGLHQGPCHPDEDEFLELDRVPFDKLIEDVMAGRLQDGKTVAALLKAKVLLGR